MQSIYDLITLEFINEHDLEHKDKFTILNIYYTNGNYRNILDSDFENSFDDWEKNGNAGYTLANGNLEVIVDSAFEGVKHYLGNLLVNPGEDYNIKLSFDKGNTVSNVRLYIQELDLGGNHLSWNTINGNLQTGHYNYTYTVNSGNRLVLRIDKDNTNTTSQTTFYIGNVSFTKSELEIIEENNYYPFGLEHKGYNNIVSANSNSVAQKFKYNGKEIDNDLGLNLYHYGFRLYDPAIGRFPSIDPASDQFPHVSTYNYAENEPVGSIDLWGLQRWKVNGRERTKEFTKDQKHSAQRSLAMQNLTYAFRLAFVVGNKSKVDKNTITAISHRLSYTARGITETNGIRHSLWSALITKKYDASFAESVGNAHEGLYMMEASEIDFSKEFDSKNTKLADSIVDLLNNEIGRRIGEENEDASNKDIMMKVLDTALEDGFWSFNKDKDGNITIFRKKLTQDQYDKIVERLNKLDDNGRVEPDEKKEEN